MRQPKLALLTLRGFPAQWFGRSACERTSRARLHDRLQLFPDALLRQVNTQILFMKSAS